MHIGQIKTIDDCINLLETARAQLNTLEEASLLAAELEKTEDRLRDRQKLIAVFGAFSAGKSSLINAIVEDNVLTVSPNPTTATVSHIVGDNYREHVEITAKTEHQMWEDVLQAALVLRHQPASLDDAMSWAGSLQVSSVPAAARRSASFLKAAATGYPEMKDKLGTTWVAEYGEIQKFTADERFACFLQRVDVPNGANLLESGITLVDTPGVDSIHRRHTDVAFDYMKKADAIIFVLYYTHAFSRADKDFLLQLAGVQDVFGLNKLFVVINAVDLAKSEGEREDVRKRVESELRGLGIRQPKVFEVSSQVAFAASQMEREPDNEAFAALIRQRLRLRPEDTLPSTSELRENSGLPTLTSTLTDFIQSQADDLAIHSTVRLINGIRERVAAQAERARMLTTNSEQEREEQRLRLKEKSHQLELRRADIDSGKSEDERILMAEWEELAFHAGERIRLRYNSLFREAFHPGRFRGTQNSRLSLQEAAEDLSAMLNRQVEVEGRTYRLRLSTQVEKATRDYRGNVSHELLIEGIAPNLSTEDGEDKERSTGDNIRSNLSSRIFASGFKHFSSPKQFFEGGGQDAMMKDLETIALDNARIELTNITDTAMSDFQVVLRESLTKVTSDAIQLFNHASNVLGTPISREEVRAWNEVAKWFDNVVEQA